MAVYLVTYDLLKPNQQYNQLLELIKRTQSWAKLGNSSYLIESNQDVTDLRDQYLEALDGNDKIFITRVVRPAAWYGLPKDVANWIREKYDE